MKRVTFRVPEDHEIACSTRISSAVVFAELGDQQSVSFIRQLGDGTYGVGDVAYGTLDEAITAAAAEARSLLRQLVISAKSKALA